MNILRRSTTHLAQTGCCPDAISRLLLGELNLGRGGACVESRRGLPARGTKPKERFLWDKRHLEELTGGEYTHEPLRVNRLGGRDPATGHKENEHVGGGTKFDYFMIDFHRRGPDVPNASYDERVIEVRSDPNRTAHIAFVAGERGKRWLIATENMRAGQIIRTFGHIPHNPLIGIEGDAHPLGALAEGVAVHAIERYPTDDCEPMVVNAGSVAHVVRQQGDFTVVRMPNKHEFALHKTCMCTIGRVSNLDFKDLRFGSAQMHRRFGYKMASGLFQKKDGYYGRRNWPQPPVRFLSEPDAPPPKDVFTLRKDQLKGSYGTDAVNPLVSKVHYRF